MDNLFDKWKVKIPKYDSGHKPIFESISQKGGGSQEKMHNFGKHFENNYELYIYAFFLGLYNNVFESIPDSSKKVDFNHAIQFWGNKTNRFDRKDFSIIQEYIFMALMAKSDIDLLELEKGEMDENDAVKVLITTMESYTNGGLQLIKEKFQEDKNFSLNPMAFLDLVLTSRNNM